MRVSRHRYYVKTCVASTITFFGAFNFISTLVKNLTLTASLLGLSTVLVAAPSQAAVINGSFESGDFTGWEKIGMAAVGTNSIGVNPTDGNYQAGLATNKNAPGASIEPI